MKVIHKAVLEIADEFTLQLPSDASIFAFANQNETPVIWYITESKPDFASDTPHRFRLLATGEPFEKIPGRYLGTALFFHGQLVYHLFHE